MDFNTAILQYISIVGAAVVTLGAIWVGCKVVEYALTNTLPLLVEVYARWRYPEKFKDE